jgi:hypothetical protein
MTAMGSKACPNDDGRIGAAMAAVVGDDGPEEAALGGHAARVRHRRAGLVHDDAVRTAPKGRPVVDHGQQVEARAPDPVAKRTAVEIEALPFEDPGLAVKRQAVAEFRDDGAPSRRH